MRLSGLLGKEALFERRGYRGVICFRKRVRRIVRRGGRVNEDVGGSARRPRPPLVREVSTVRDLAVDANPIGLEQNLQKYTADIKRMHAQC